MNTNERNVFLCNFLKGLDLKPTREEVPYNKRNEVSETILLTLSFYNTRLLNFSMIYEYFECIFLLQCVYFYCKFMAIQQYIFEWNTEKWAKMPNLVEYLVSVYTFKGFSIFFVVGICNNIIKYILSTISLTFCKMLFCCSIYRSVD